MASQFDFSLFQNTIENGQSYTGAFIKEWCEYHNVSGKTTGNPYYEAYTIYKNHWVLSEYPPNPNAYYYPEFGTARIGYILKRDTAKSPKKL